MYRTTSQEGLGVQSTELCNFKMSEICKTKDKRNYKPGLQLRVVPHVSTD